MMMIMAIGMMMTNVLYNLPNKNRECYSYMDVPGIKTDNYFADVSLVLYLSMSETRSDLLFATYLECQ